MFKWSNGQATGPCNDSVDMLEVGLVNLQWTTVMLVRNERVAAPPLSSRRWDAALAGVLSESIDRNYT